MIPEKPFSASCRRVCFFERSLTMVEFVFADPATGLESLRQGTPRRVCPQWGDPLGAAKKISGSARNSPAPRRCRSSEFPRRCGVENARISRRAEPIGQGLHSPSFWRWRWRAGGLRGKPPPAPLRGLPSHCVGRFRDNSAECFESPPASGHSRLLRAWPSQRVAWALASERELLLELVWELAGPLRGSLSR